MEECLYFSSSDEEQQSGYCGIATQIVCDETDHHQPVATSDEACQACLRSQPTFGINRVTISLAISAVMSLDDQDGVKIILEKHSSNLRKLTTRLPPILQQAFSVSAALAEFTKDPRFAKPETYEERLEKCHACPSRQEHRCTICGCYIVFKAQLPHSRCPVYQWEAEKTPSSE